MGSIILSFLALSVVAHAQSSITAAVCASRNSSLQKLLDQDLSAVPADCKKEIDDSLSANSTTSCFTDPLQATPTVVRTAGNTGMVGASATSQAAYNLASQQNETQKNYCYLHYNRISATCTDKDSAPALKALNDFANCSSARQALAQSLSAQSGSTASAASAASKNVQVAGLKGAAMGCYLATCAIMGGMGTVTDTMNPTAPIQHSIEDIDLPESTQGKPRMPAMIDAP